MAKKTKFSVAKVCGRNTDEGVIIYDMFRKCLLTLIVAILLSFWKVAAQTPDSVLNNKIHIWNKYAEYRTGDLYVHLDKSLYAKNEKILFTAYLLGRGGVIKPHTMYVALIDPNTNSVVNVDRFLMHDGLGSGALSIPDTVESGQYLFVAYTNALKENDPAQFFRQPVSVKAKKVEDFNVTISVASSAGSGDSINMNLKITTDYR